MAKKPEDVAVAAPVSLLANAPKLPHSDEKLLAAAAHFHRKGGFTKAAVVGADIVHVNAKGQTVVTDKAIAARHADYLDSLEPDELAALTATDE